MPENAKINLSALMKNKVPDTTSDKIESTEDKPSDVSSMIKPKLNMISPGQTKAPQDNTNESPVDDNAQTATVEDDAEKGTQHALSLDRLLSRGKTKEQISKENDEKEEIKKHLQEVEDQEKNQAPTEKQEDTELFGNYESKFSSQSGEILKKLRMPKTRIGMLASLCGLSIMIIGVLMYTNPETHSLENYKASIIEIVKNSEKPSQKADATQKQDTNTDENIESPQQEEPLAEDVNTQETQAENPVQNNINNQPPTQERIQEIKEENLKNFLRENFQ